MYSGICYYILFLVPQVLNNHIIFLEVLFHYYLLFLLLYVLSCITSFLDCFGLFFFLNRGSIRNNTSPSKRRVRSASTLPSLDPHFVGLYWVCCWGSLMYRVNYFGPWYMTLSRNIPWCMQKMINFVLNPKTNSYLHNIC